MTPDIDNIYHVGHPMKNQIKLRAGNLSMNYEEGNIRHVLAGQTEIIRMIYSAVRDKNWLTIEPEIINEEFNINDTNFIARYTARFKSEEIDFLANIHIEGKPDNSLAFSFEGEALNSFEKNRIGLCTLHPVEPCAGLICRIEHTDGTSEESEFPEFISPHQIFRDIKSMAWVINGIHCRIDFEGDVFETEDQRNWTDASFKTYSTPLSVPYPSIIKKGTSIFQKVTFSVEGSVGPDDSDDKIIIRLFPEESLRLPEIGICQSRRLRQMTLSETKVIRSIRFDHYRVDLHLYRNGWQFKAEQGSRESLDLGYPLELALFFDDNLRQQVNNFVDWYSRRRLAVTSILLFHKSFPSTPDKLAEEIIPIIRSVDPDVKIATGTNANFAELNRNRPGETGNDSVCFSIHPQEHASDNLTLTENLKGQAYTIRSARIFAGNKGIHVSPVNIQRRFNANNFFIESPYIGKEAPPQIDLRLMSLFGACWTAISLKYLCESGADSITYYETVGERGIFQGDYDSQWPEHFPAVKDMIFPAFHVFRFILGNKKLKLIKSISSKPLVTNCMVLSDGKQARIILVNFTGTSQTLQLECCSGLLRIRTLSAASYAEASQNCRWTGIENENIIKSQNSFEIEPYSINFIEGWRKH